MENMDASLHLADIATGTVQTLVDTAELAEMTPAVDLAVLIGQLQWLADSESIAFNTYAIDRAGGPGVGRQEDLWTVDLMGNLIERFPAGEGGGTFVISPDDVVVFGQTTAVVRVNLDGSNRETLIDFDFVNTASEFSFYPWLQWVDNDTSAMVTISPPEPYTGEANLWRVPLSGDVEKLETVEVNVIFNPVVWSNSGLQLGYVRHTDELFIGEGDGSRLKPYADNATHFWGWNLAEGYFVYAGLGSYAVGQLGEMPLVVDLAEGQTAVSAQWLNDNTFIIALGSADNWDFRLQTVEGPATRLVSGSTTPLFDSWTP
jgi:hypothetical protein